MPRHPHLFVLLALAAAACGHFADVAAGRQALATARPAAASLADLSFEPLTYPAKRAFRIDAESPAFDFATHGRSFYKAFALPAGAPDYQLVVRGYAAPVALDGVAIFAPLVTLLDAEKRPIATSKATALRYEDLFSAEADRPARLRFDTTIASQGRARYAVIHTSRDAVDSGGLVAPTGELELTLGPPEPVTICHPQVQSAHCLPAAMPPPPEFVHSDPAYEAFAAAPPAGTRYADLSYEAIGASGGRRVAIDERSGVFDFAAHGRSFFRAFALPAEGGAYRLVVRSEPVGGRAFIPIVTLLDADKQPIATSGIAAVRRDDGSSIDPRKEGPRRLELLIGPASRARYAVIHTSQDLVEFSRQGFPLGNVLSNPWVVPLVPGSPVGNLEISLLPVGA
jgi:hypothetical protein